MPCPGERSKKAEKTMRKCHGSPCNTKGKCRRYLDLVRFVSSTEDGVGCTRDRCLATGGVCWTRTFKLEHALRRQRGGLQTRCVEAVIGLRQELKRRKGAVLSSRRTLNLEGLEEDVEALLCCRDDGTVEVQKWIRWELGTSLSRGSERLHDKLAFGGTQTSRGTWRHVRKRCDHFHVSLSTARWSFSRTSCAGVTANHGEREKKNSMSGWWCGASSEPFDWRTRTDFLPCRIRCVWSATWRRIATQLVWENGENRSEKACWKSGTYFAQALRMCDRRQVEVDLSEVSLIRSFVRVNLGDTKQCRTVPNCEWPCSCGVFLPCRTLFFCVLTAGC